MASEQDTTSLDAILKLVESACTGKEIQNLLRKAKKGAKPVRISGTTETVIYQNLRDAIQTGAVTKAAVYDMVAESEESGSQHIFYFEPKTQYVRDVCNDAEGVGEKLFGSDWRIIREFPKFYNKASGVEWADFRIEPTGQQGQNGWIAKLYSGIIKERHIDTRREGEGQGRFAKIFEEYLARQIFLVRWHHFGLLELRVPLERKLKVLMDTVQGLWTSIEKVVDSRNFEPLDLTIACKRIIDQNEKYRDLYRLGDARVLDQEGGSTKFSPRSGEDHLTSAEARRKSLQLFDDCQMLVVIWLLNERSHDTREELRTVVGKVRTHEATIAAKTTAKAIQHVTHKLYYFARSKPIPTAMEQPEASCKLSSSFGKSRAKYPELANVFDNLEDWIKSNPNLSHIEINRFKKAKPQVSLGELAFALSVLVEDGILEEQYAIVAPTNHALAPQFFNSPDEIPDQLYDTELTLFNVDEGELIPIYRESAYE